MDGNSVEIGDHVSFLLVELAFGVFLVLFEKGLEVGVLRCAAEDFLVKLFDDLEIRKGKNHKESRILTNKWRDDPLRAQGVEVQYGGHPFVPLLSDQTKPVGVSAVKIRIAANIIEED